jgi:hypothetical protein
MKERKTFEMLVFGVYDALKSLFTVERNLIAQIMMRMPNISAKEADATVNTLSERKEIAMEDEPVARSVREYQKRYYLWRVETSKNKSK